MSEPVTEVVIPGESAGMHSHPHTHDQFDHTHPEIIAEIAALQAAREAEAIATVAAVSAEASQDAAVEAVIVAEDSRTELQMLRDEMLAGFEELRAAQTVVPVASATLPGEGADAVVEEPEQETHRKPPAKKAGGWF